MVEVAEERVDVVWCVFKGGGERHCEAGLLVK